VQFGVGDVGVAADGREVGVSEVGGNQARIACFLAEPGCSCVAECVRGHMLVDNLVDLLRRKQAPVSALMTGLAASLPARSFPSWPWWRRRRVLRRRQRRVPRTPIQTPLKLTHPSLQPPVRLDQLTDPQKQLDRGLTITIQNRLRLNPLHTTTFAITTKDPLPGVNAYLFLCWWYAGKSSGLPDSSLRRFPWNRSVWGARPFALGLCRQRSTPPRER
jgi:hypothetical protein